MRRRSATCPSACSQQVAIDRSCIHVDATGGEAALTKTDDEGCEQRLCDRVSVGGDRCECG